MRQQLRKFESITIYLLIAFVIMFFVQLQSFAQLNENCTVSIFNRTVNVQSDGTWTLPNTPSNMGRVRARATCVDIETGVTISGVSDYFTLIANRAITVSEINFGNDIGQVPSSLTVNADTLTLRTIGETVQLSVIATFPDSSTTDFTAGNRGTNYTASNTDVATVSNNGLVTAVSSGTVMVSAMNEGALG